MAQKDYLAGQYTAYLNDASRRKHRGKASNDCILADNKYEFSLSFEEYHAIVTQKCYYCGALPQRIVKHKKAVLFIHGIDRRDNNLGYTRENSVSCCSQCNYAKGKMTARQFTSWLQNAAINQLITGELNETILDFAHAIVAKAANKETSSTRQEN